MARTMLDAALREAGALAYEGMVFNFVVASNRRAVELWQASGFEVAGP